MSNYYVVTRSPDYLEHHGILGMKWGIRRYQNKDGSLTPEGRARYGDVLTKKQMQGYIKDYNLRTGSNKTINKNTVFKTADGLYDYKGRKINTDVSVDDPMNKVEKKTETKPKIRGASDMTDEELRAANQRMQMEEDYKRHLANAMPPKKVGVVRSFLGNFKTSLVRDIPEGISGGLKQAITNALKDAFKEEQPEDKTRTNINRSTTNLTDKELKAYVDRLDNEMKAVKYRETIDNYWAKQGEEMMSDVWNTQTALDEKLEERSAYATGNANPYIQGPPRKRN
jgi:hypothetical protein